MHARKAYRSRRDLPALPDVRGRRDRGRRDGVQMRAADSRPATARGPVGRLQDGRIDLVATDHSPAPPSTKCVDEGDFLRAWGGIASLQLGLRGDVDRRARARRAARHARALDVGRPCAPGRPLARPKGSIAPAPTPTSSSGIRMRQRSSIRQTLLPSASADAVCRHDASRPRDARRCCAARSCIRGRRGRAERRAEK